MQVEIRLARQDDLSEVLDMTNTLNEEKGYGPGRFTAEKLKNETFCDTPIYQIILVFVDGEAAGYSLIFDGYDTVMAARSLIMADLYIRPAHRIKGLGRRLMEAVAAHAEAKGAVTVSWYVREANERARAFYRSLGAKDAGVRLKELNQAAITALSRAADSRSKTK